MHSVTSNTYHFLQAINEVADNVSQAFELLEHGAELLARALAHIGAHIIRLLTDDVCGDGGAHIHNFCALAHNISIIWRGRKNETSGRERYTNEQHR